MEDNTVYFFGYSKLREGIPAGDVYDKVTLVVGVNMESKRIVDVEVTLPAELARRMIASCIEGRNIETESEEIERNIWKRYRGEAQKPVIAAFRKVLERYRHYRVDGDD